MKTIYVMGTEASGKTTVGLGLALFLKGRGYKVCYFKPVGYSPWPTQKEDEDAVLLKHVLEMSCDVKEISPLQIGPMYLSSRQQRKKYRQEVYSALDKFKKEQVDILIVGGATTPYVVASQKLDDCTLAAELGTAVIFIINIKNDFHLDQAIFYNRYLECSGIKVLGNVFNNIPRATMEKTRGVHQPLLEENGCHVIGIIPASPELTSPTVREYLEVLGGELLTGEDYLQRRVDDIVVGTMTIEGALKFLRRSNNKAVITGGDRSDMALTALETSTSVLVLTGGLYPNVKVISRAEEKEVPVILVHYDTFTAVERLHVVSHKIKPFHADAVELARKNIETYCDWTALWGYLEISPGK